MFISPDGSLFTGSDGRMARKWSRTEVREGFVQSPAHIQMQPCPHRYQRK